MLAPTELMFELDDFVVDSALNSFKAESLRAFRLSH